MKKNFLILWIFLTIASLGYSQDSLPQSDTTDPSVLVKMSQLRVATQKMIRLTQLELEMDDLVMINEDLVQLNADYQRQANLDRRAIENLKSSAFKYDNIIEKDSIMDVQFRKEVRKKGWRIGIISFFTGAIFGLLVSLF